ncbi:ubiquitin conjugation factor E4 B [Sporothrix schenckii 1099-18]|uniref:Ubiquitin conjugation factor E4 B n=1 Tax=Sporothrix schenckii 1099-18 TaxID=1397361 RepID=A0A0F2M2Q6_SPOSC|nr:ubiquitin conjugation factor E4 B [Sporothrix schenckii 1099-18]KJR83983.1 ubiquitin conjugation factor E4 B [Sporothrix schenckii 1099-18]
MDPNEGQEPTLPSAEQMRARRLAKLGGGASSSSGNGAASSSSTSTSTSVPQDGAATSTSPKPAAAASPASPASSAAAASTPTPAPATRKITITPKQTAASSSSGNDQDHARSRSAGREASPSKRPRLALAANTPTGVPQKQQASAAHPIASPKPSTPAANPVSAADALAEWTDTTISNLLHVTVSPTQTKNRHGTPLTLLNDLRSEILDRAGGEEAVTASGKPLRLTADDIDAAFQEACSAYTDKKPLLDYLLPIYKTVTKQIKTRITVPQRVAVLQEIKRLCMSNIVFALTMPELFGREPNPSHDTLMPNLLRGMRSDDPLSLDMDFLTDIVARFDEDEDGILQGVFTKSMIDISAKLATMTMDDEYPRYIEAMMTYTRFKPLLVAVAQHPYFQMAQSAPNIERYTILGPFFRISPLQPEVSKTYFGGSHKTEPTRKEAVYGALQLTLNQHQSDLHAIAMAFARAGDGPRNKLLDWFAYALNVNHKRRALQVNAKEVASDGFMMNVGAVLDRMCEPFMEASFSRMERIEIEYLRRQPRIDISDETKLNADQAQADAFYATTAAGESKFVSELFFLNMASHHYGGGAAGQKFKDMDREIKHMEEQLAMLQEEKRKLVAAGAPATHRSMALVEQHLQTYTAAIDRHVAYRYSLEAVLLDEKMQQRALMFMRYVSVWLLRVASGSDYTPDKELQIPLPAAQPEAFSCLPEYALQNVVDHLKFLFRRVPRILPSAVGDEMVALCITFLESSEYIRNPYLKSSLVSLLFSGTWRMYHLANGVLGDALTNSAFANKHLLHALMKFYIECEQTGAHTAFYDKFNIRYEIFQVIKAVWPNDLYKRQLTQQSKTNRSFFVQFVNLLLNDATYVLDEALSRFPKIHELQRELQSASAAGLRPDERQQKETELKQAENQAQSYMQLANETVSMMKLFTEALSEAFTMPEIVSRLAGMLDYNLVTLAGPASRNLKVENPEKYFFNPKVLLPQIVELYLNLGDKASFVEAVADDGRSYKPAIFESATRILTNKGLMDPAKLAAWDALRAKFATAKALLDQAETDLGEIPAEFEDPIMGDLMKDPVVLPSRHIVDRSTIVQHLLSDPKDPFTRQPMTADDVVPATELKEKIDAWKADRVAAALAKNKESGGASTVTEAIASATNTGTASTAAVPSGREDDGDAMDTTE